MALITLSQSHIHGCLSIIPFTQAFINNSYPSKLNKVTPKLSNQKKPARLKCLDVNLIPSAGGTLVHLPTHTTISDSGEEHQRKEWNMPSDTEENYQAHAQANQ